MTPDTSDTLATLDMGFGVVVGYMDTLSVRVHRGP